MNGVPNPLPNNTRFEHDGREYIITAHAPNAEDWMYEAHPTDLSGAAIHVPHHDVQPITPRPVGSVLPDVARDLMARSGLSLDVFDDEVEEAESPLAELLSAVAAVIHSGPHRIPDLRGAYIRFQEQGT